MARSPHRSGHMVVRRKFFHLKSFFSSQHIFCSFFFFLSFFLSLSPFLFLSLPFLFLLWLSWLSHSLGPGMRYLADPLPLYRIHCWVRALNPSLRDSHNPHKGKRDGERKRERERPWFTRSLSQWSNLLPSFLSLSLHLKWITVASPCPCANFNLGSSMWMWMHSLPHSQRIKANSQRNWDGKPLPVRAQCEVLCFPFHPLLYSHWRWKGKREMHTQKTT